MESLIGVGIIILSIILHEVAHGYVANWLGDPTARLAGRLTLNPFPHIDPFGSVLLPGLLAITGSPFVIGWAKPVPYNPYNVRGGKWGEAAVAAAGPATNILIAIAFGLLVRALGTSIPPFVVMVIIANLILALYNLVPIPPLDGSKILRALLPNSVAHIYDRVEHTTYALGPIGLIIALLIILNVFSGPVGAFVTFLFSLITGLHF